MQETTAEVTRQTPQQRSNSQRTFVLTNFYPTYDRANDQVDRVVPVRRTIFQRVIPRYRLSTSETRDEGLGPAFIDVPYVTSSRSAKAGGSRSVIAPTPSFYRPAPLSHDTGTRVDIYA